VYLQCPNLILFWTKTVSPGWTKSSTLVSFISPLANLSFRQLCSFFKRKSKLCVMCIRPILYYDIEPWFDCAATHRKKNTGFQNKYHWLRSTEALHEEVGVSLIKELELTFPILRLSWRNASLVFFQRPNWLIPAKTTGNKLSFKRILKTALQSAFVRIQNVELLKSQKYSFIRLITEETHKKAFKKQKD